MSRKLVPKKYQNNPEAVNAFYDGYNMALDWAAKVMQNVCLKKEKPKGKRGVFTAWEEGGPVL